MVFSSEKYNTVGCADWQLRQSREITFTGSYQAAACICASKLSASAPANCLCRLTIAAEPWNYIYR